MLKWILLVVIVVAFPSETGQLLAATVDVTRNTLHTVIASFNKGI
jgi:hypothetical protein